MILKANGAELGITEPFEMFWATGLLSSFLDNTPTYLVFLTTAGALGLSQGMVTALGTVPVKMLEAISAALYLWARIHISATRRTLWSNPLRMRTVSRCLRSSDI